MTNRRLGPAVASLFPDGLRPISERFSPSFGDTSSEEVAKIDRRNGIKDPQLDCSLVKDQKRDSGKLIFAP